MRFELMLFLKSAGVFPENGPLTTGVHVEFSNSNESSAAMQFVSLSYNDIACEAELIVTVAVYPDEQPDICITYCVTFSV